MTCCIRLFDPCIKYAQCLCADGLILLARKECLFCFSFPECYPYNRNLWFVKNVLMVIDSVREWLGIQWVTVTLYFHLREKIAKRLHHGLSKTIVVNTLTDVREFKKHFKHRMGSRRGAATLGWGGIIIFLSFLSNSLGEGPKIFILGGGDNFFLASWHFD